MSALAVGEIGVEDRLTEPSAQEPATDPVAEADFTAYDDDRHSFCGVPIPEAIYAGPRTRAEFDRIPLPENVFEWSEDSTATLLRNDGRRWERRCRAKHLASVRPAPDVIFQWFDERPIAAPGGQP